MKAGIWLVAGFILVGGLAGCGAVKNELRAAKAEAIAEEERGWKIPHKIDHSFLAAKQFLEKKDGSTPSMTNTGAGPFGSERKFHTGNRGAARYEFYVGGRRLNNGPLPDQDNSQLRKIVYQKKSGDKWVDAPEAEVQALAKEFLDFAKTVKLK